MITTGVTLISNYFGDYFVKEINLIGGFILIALPFMFLYILGQESKEVQDEK